MTVYRTCYGCISRGKPCERRDAITKMIKGLGVQSMKFKCDVRKPVFAIGTPVWVDTVWKVDGEGDENGTFTDFFPGHVVGDLGNKVMVYVKPGCLGRDDPHEDYPFTSSTNGFCKVSLKKLSVRDGEVEAICKDCSLPASMGHMKDYMCDPAFVAEMKRLAEVF